MIDRTVILDTMLQRARKLPVGHGFEVLTYKRNRGMAVVRTGEDSFDVLEHGYSDERFEDVCEARLKKLCKTLLRREFPRSTKVRLYQLGEFDEAVWRDTRRKVL